MCDGDCDYCDLDECEEEMDYLKEECKYCDGGDCDTCYVNDMIRENEIEKSKGKDPIIFS